MDNRFSKGDIVQHFKRELLSAEEREGNMYMYEIVGVATHSETGEQMMVYKPLYGDHGMYVRPLEMFLSEVDHAKYPNVKQQYRFEKAHTDSNGLTEEQFLAGYNSDKYPKPSLTADIVVFKVREGEEFPEVLLIRRKGHPFIGCLALPGGFSEPGETIETTAARELEEETGVKGLGITLVGIYSKPGRDPRGWTVSAAFTAKVKEGEIKPSAGDDADEVCWAKVMPADSSVKSDSRLTIQLGGNDVSGEMAFDHYDIISDAYRTTF